MFVFLERLKKLLVFIAFFRPSFESMLNMLNSFISITCVVVVSGSCVQRLPVRSGGHRRVPQSSSPQRKPPPGGVCQCVQLPPLVIHALASPLGTLSLSFTWKVDFWVITNTNQSCAEFNKVFISKNCHHYSNRSCRDLNLCVHDFQNWNLPIDGGLDDQLWVSERLFYQHLGIHVHVYCYIQLIENNQVCIVYQMHNKGIKFITNWRNYTSNCEVWIDSKLILNGRKVNKIAYAFTFTSFLFWMCQECLWIAYWLN